MRCRIQSRRMMFSWCWCRVERVEIKGISPNNYANGLTSIARSEMTMPSNIIPRPVRFPMQYFTYNIKSPPICRLIIMSLRQHHGSMSYSNVRNENILELCSITEQTPRLINAFAQGKFF